MQGSTPPHYRTVPPTRNGGGAGYCSSTQLYGVIIGNSNFIKWRLQVKKKHDIMCGGREGGGERDVKQERSSYCNYITVVDRSYS